MNDFVAILIERLNNIKLHSFIAKQQAMILKQKKEKLSQVEVCDFACDRVGGAAKRLAAQPSLKRPYNHQIQTPLQLYEWAIENISSNRFVTASVDDV